MSDTSSTNPGDKPQLLVAFGLSQADFADVVRSMMAVVRRVGCPGHVHPLEVVHDAFVTALCKPISERPAVTDRKRFVAWMCTLAELAALTNRKSKHRRLLGGNTSDAQLEALANVAGFGDALAAREAVRKALATLTPDDQALIVARHVEGKTIAEIAREQNRPWTTVDSRHTRAMGLLRAAIRSLVAIAVLLRPKKVRAQSISWTARASRLVVPLTQTTYAVGVTIICGALVSANSSAASTDNEVMNMATSAATMSTFVAPPAAAQIAPPNLILPPTNADPGPVKPSVVDSAAAEWFARDMTLTKVASLLQGTVFPFALLVVPAAAELGCAGANRQAPAAQQPEEEENEDDYRRGVDPYDGMCAEERRRGNDCPSRAEWYGEMGRCPDGKPGCTK